MNDVNLSRIFGTVGEAWTNERVEQLKALWTAGKSASECARELGGITRNSVISKVHRLRGAGVVLRAGAVRGTPKSIVYKKPPVPKIVPLPPPPPPQAPVILAAPPNELPEDAPGRRTIMTIRAFECRWPIGDPQDNDFTLCGASCVGLYCGPHSDRAFTPPPPSQRTANDLERSLRRYV